METDIFYKAANDTIGIKADPAIIDDLITVLVSILTRPRGRVLLSPSMGYSFQILTEQILRT